MKAKKKTTSQEVAQLAIEREAATLNGAPVPICTAPAPTRSSRCQDVDR